MPLRATINKNDVIAPSLNSEEWDILKVEIKKNNFDVILPCCGQKGNLRTSKLGLNHFYHKPSEIKCNWKPESPEHLFLKFEILKACKECGWTAIPEFSENDWRADIIAIQGNKRIAFEVQISNQTYEETVERQNKYKRDNVRGCWFFKKLPKELTRYYDEDISINNKDLPIFELDFSTDEIAVKFNSQKFSVKDFVIHLLSRHFKFCNTVQSELIPKIDITFLEMTCWKCKRITHVYCVEESVKSKCGLYVSVDDDGMWGNYKFEFHPQIIDKAKQIAMESNGEIALGEIKKRYSKTTNSSYKSFGCAYCDSIIGDWFIMEAKNEQAYDLSPMCYEIEIHLNKPYIENHKHWCFSENNDFCE